VITRSVDCTASWRIGGGTGLDIGVGVGPSKRNDAITRSRSCSTARCLKRISVALWLGPARRRDVKLAPPAFCAVTKPSY